MLPSSSARAGYATRREARRRDRQFMERPFADLLRRTVQNSGVTLSYPGGSSLPGTRGKLASRWNLSDDRLDSDELVRMLRSMWFAVLPSGTMDESEDRRSIAEFSLPSRLVYLMCTSHIPVIVLGSRDTAAAHFVEQFGIGVVANYDRDSFLNAVHHISRPEINLAMRRRGFAAAGRFVDTGVGEWIWQSLAKGEPFDRRFEDLLPQPAQLRSVSEPRPSGSGQS